MKFKTTSCIKKQPTKQKVPLMKNVLMTIMEKLPLCHVENIHSDFLVIPLKHNVRFGILRTQKESTINVLALGTL